MEYTPLNYYTLGTVYPRERTRRPYPRRRRRTCIPVIYPRRPGDPVYPTACVVARRGESIDLVTRGDSIELVTRGLASTVEVRT